MIDVNIKFPVNFSNWCFMVTLSVHVMIGLVPMGIQVMCVNYLISDDSTHCVLIFMSTQKVVKFSTQNVLTNESSFVINDALWVHIYFSVYILMLCTFFRKFKVSAFFVRILIGITLALCIFFVRLSDTL